MSSDHSIELEEIWEKVYLQCAKSADDYPYSKAEGFKEAFLKYLRQAVYKKQCTRKPMNLTEASNITDECAGHAIGELRASFVDRNDPNRIIEAMRAAGVMLIPGDEKVTVEKYTGVTRFVCIVATVETYMLSPHEVEVLINTFGTNYCQYERSKHILTIEANKIPLEGPEPTPIEQLAIKKEAAHIIPLMIAHFCQTTNAPVEWKSSISQLSRKLFDRIGELFGQKLPSLNPPSKSKLDMDEVTKIFEE